MALGRRVVLDQVPNFAGGLNTVSSESSLGENQMRLATNVRLTQFGAAKKRGGTQRITTSAFPSGSVRSLTEWSTSAGARYIFATAFNEVKWATYGTLPISFSSITGTLDAGAPADAFSWAAFRDATGDAMYVSGGAALNKITVAGGPVFTITAAIASTPVTTCLEVYNQRLWGCGSSTYPQAIFYSDLNDGDTLGVGASGGGQINVRTFGQQNVTALKSLGTSLLIFHRGGVSRLTGFGQDDTLVVPAGVTGDVGTIAPASVVRVGNVVYYVNVRGLFVASAEYVQPVNTPEKPDPLSIVLPLLTETQLSNVSACLYRATNELVIHVPTIGTYVYHTILQSWAGPWDGTFVSNDRQNWAEVGNASGAPVLLKGSTDNYIELVDASGEYTDSASASGTDGTAFTMVLQARRMMSGDFADCKSYRWTYLIGTLDGSEDTILGFDTGMSAGETDVDDSGEGDFALTTESGSYLSTESGLTLVSRTGETRMRVPTWGTGYYIDYTIRDASSTACPVFSRIETSGFSLGRR